MKKLRILFPLTTNDNDYQIEQAQSAEQRRASSAWKLQIGLCGNDAITQSTQILRLSRRTKISGPNAIVFEPVGALPYRRLARAAATAGIGWAVLNS